MLPWEKIQITENSGHEAFHWYDIKYGSKNSVFVVY